MWGKGEGGLHSEEEGDWGKKMKKKLKTSRWRERVGRPCRKKNRHRRERDGSLCHVVFVGDRTGNVDPQ